MPLRLSIVTPMRPLVEADVDSVIAPGSEGEFGVMPGHAPFLIGLKPGVVRWSEGGRTTRAAISGGFAEVTQERVTVLARNAELGAQIDAAAAERERSEAAAALARVGSAAPPEEVERLQEALERAQARVDAAKG
jgi:F-type H+-transporting ATPase subunit epsilon